MDINDSLNNVLEEEKEYFYKKSSSEFFEYIKNSDEYKSVEKKLQIGEKLTKEDWEYIISRLFLVYARALPDEVRNDLSGKLLLLLTKINMKLFKNDEEIYNTNYKTNELFHVCDLDVKVNDFLRQGLLQVVLFKKEEDLACLLEQYEIANQFRNSKDSFIDSFHKTSIDEITNNEKLFIHAYHHAYEKEKQLVKRYSPKKN